MYESTERLIAEDLNRHRHLCEFVPWLRRLVAYQSLQRFGFDPRLLHVRFVVEKVVLLLVHVSGSI